MSTDFQSDLEIYKKSKARIVVFKEDGTTSSGEVSMVKEKYFGLDQPSIEHSKRLHVMAYNKIQCIMPVEEYLKAGGDLDKEKE